MLASSSVEGDVPGNLTKLMINRIQVTFIAAVCLSIPAFASADVEATIKQIRADYNATESAKMQTQDIALDEDAEVVKMTKYYKDGELAKIKYVTGGDHGYSTDYFYYKGGRLYFVFEESSFWSFDTNGPEGTTIGTAVERRVYFGDNGVIRHLLKEVKARDESKLAGLLKKTANQPVRDADAVIDLENTGYILMDINNPVQLEKFIYGE